MSEKRSDTSVSGKSFVRGKTIDDDERSRGRPSAARVVRRVSAEKKAACGVRRGSKRLYSASPKKPIPKGPPHKAAARRVTVKVSYAQNRKPGQWAAHGDYLEREGAQKEEGKGRGFDAKGDVSLRSKLHEWQMADDPRLFKVVISPEDGNRLDLQSYTREYMARLAEHLKANPEDLEWVAIDHYNTAHPHAHVLIRGKDNLQIPRELLRSGMRELASELATERLGYRSPAEISAAKNREIDAPKLTQIDRALEKIAKPLPDGRSLVAELPVNLGEKDYEDQRRRMARLEALERLGLAEKIGHAAWALDKGWTKGLKELEVVRTRTKMVAESRALMTEPRCLPQVTKLEEGERLVGRVLGTGLDEQFDRSYIIIEGTDYRAHIVYQTTGIEKARAERQLDLRHLVALEGKEKGKVSAIDYDLVIPDKPKKVQIPEKALDDALDSGQKPDIDAAQTGFQKFWHAQLLERQRQRALEKEKAQEKERIKVTEKNRAKDMEALKKTRGNSLE